MLFNYYLIVDELMDMIDDLKNEISKQNVIILSLTSNVVHNTADVILNKDAIDANKDTIDAKMVRYFMKFYIILFCVPTTKFAQKVSSLHSRIRLK